MQRERQDMKTTATKAERAALARWYGEDVSQIEELFASDTVHARDEAAKLEEPTFQELEAARGAASDAAWAIIHRARKDRA